MVAVAVGVGVVVAVGVGVAVGVVVGVVVGVAVGVGVGVAVGVVVGVVVGVTMTHPAESLHWYTRTGTPAYEVKARDGTMRPTTLRDARKSLLLPSVTTIIRVAAAPGLERWKLRNLGLACMTLPRLPDESADAFLERAEADAREQAKAAAELGTSIHAELEGFYADALSPVKHALEVQGVVDLLAMRYPGRKWQAERTFASEAGYAGKCDLCADNISPKIVLDAKSKPFTETDDFNKLAWPEMAMQIVAYASGLYPHDADVVCGNVFVSTTVPGLTHLHLWTEPELDKAYRMFMALLEFWKAKTGYDSAFSERDIEAAEAAERG